MPKQNFTIKNWSQSDQPREKLRDKGKAVLSNAELLAILIGSGNTEESAVALCQRMLALVDNNLSQLSKLTLNQLMQFKGIGQAKAISIIAALELGKRRLAENVLQQETITSSDSVFNLLQPILGELQHEEFWVIYLNNSNKILQKNQLSKGGITGTIVDTRLLYKTALQVGATAIIIAHNHPSGTIQPSSADKKLTQKIKKAGENLDIKLLDHLIITEKAYFSFANEALL